MNVVLRKVLIHSVSSPISFKFFPKESPSHGYALFFSNIFLSERIFDNSGKHFVSNPSNILRSIPKKSRELFVVFCGEIIVN